MFKYDWGSIIVDIVKKKDLDGGDFSDCWTEDYDWTELDNYVIDNFREEVIQWCITRYDCDYGQAEHDLNEYKQPINEGD